MVVVSEMGWCWQRGSYAAVACLGYFLWGAVEEIQHDVWGTQGRDIRQEAEEQLEAPAGPFKTHSYCPAECINQPCLSGGWGNVNSRKCDVKECKPHTVSIIWIFWQSRCKKWIKKNNSWNIWEHVAAKICLIDNDNSSFVSGENSPKK